MYRIKSLLHQLYKSKLTDSNKLFLQIITVVQIYNVCTTYTGFSFWGEKSGFDILPFRAFFIHNIWIWNNTQKLDRRYFWPFSIGIKKFNKLPFFFQLCMTIQLSVSLNTLCLIFLTKLHLWIITVHQFHPHFYIKVSQIWSCKENCLSFHKWLENIPYKMNFFTSSLSTVDRTIVILHR